MLDPLSGRDRITLRGVRATGYHGVLPQERASGQEFVVDVTLFVSTVEAAARADDLGQTVDYAAVAQAIVDLVAGEPVALIETLAVALAHRCLEFPQVAEVEVTVHKPQAPIPVPFQDVCVTISRAR